MPTIAISVPFPDAAGISKNRTKRVGKRRMYLSDDGRLAREVLRDQLRGAVGDTRWVRNRVQVNITLAKSGARKDAANFVDETCDAVEHIIGVNDSWFDVSAVWTLSKTEEVRVEVSQDDSLVDSHICSACTRVLPLEAFYKTLGFCKECNRGKNRAAAAARKIREATEHESLGTEHRPVQRTGPNGQEVV